MRKIILFLLVSIKSQFLFAQGYNHNWLVGYWPNPYQKGRMQFDSNAYSYNYELRKMLFADTQGNISDSNGDLLMSSNGQWIANSTGDTMQNGAGLNPNSFAGSWIHGLPLLNANLFLPMPNDSTKYILLHHSAEFNGSYSPTNELLYSIIDITKDSGLGGVDSANKNVVFFNDTLNWGFGATKHANGRDWWIVVSKDSTDIIFKFLLTPSGIQYFGSQKLNVPLAWGNVTQLVFNKQGNKFGFCTYTPYTTVQNYAMLFDFDRCSGLFSNPHTIILDRGFLWGDAFSASGNYFYTCSSGFVFQINTITYTVDTVAVYDGFYFPIQGAATTFDMMYLAANGKIYIGSGGSVQHIHEMNFPDSAGLKCDVQQHSIFLNIWHFRSQPNHPNYYLGCDTSLGCPCLANVGFQEIYPFNRLNIYPNPSNGSFNIGYDASPQSSLLKVYDVNGKVVHTQYLPPWSNEQSIKLPKLGQGIYLAVMQSGNHRISKKFILSKD